MLMRNLTMFRFPAAPLAHLFADNSREEGGSFEVLPTLFEQSIALDALRPVGPLELSSAGFVSPYGPAYDRLTMEVLIAGGRHGVGITVGTEDKILPAAAVNAALAKKLAALEQQQGRKPGGRMRKQIKEDLIHDMLPKALVRPTRTDAILDLKRGVIFVDTPARRRGEMVVSQVRHALGSFPALPLNAEVAPRSVLTGWLAGEPLPEGLALGEAAILKDASERGARVKLDGQELQSDEVARHLEAGKQCTRLALVLDDRLAFTVDEDLAVRGLRFLDGAMDALESIERDDLQAELDARFVLACMELGRLFDVLESAFRLTKAEGGAA